MKDDNGGITENAVLTHSVLTRGQRSDQAF